LTLSVLYIIISILIILFWIFSIGVVIMSNNTRIYKNSKEKKITKTLILFVLLSFAYIIIHFIWALRTVF